MKAMERVHISEIIARLPRPLTVDVGGVDQRLHTFLTYEHFGAIACINPIYKGVSLFGSNRVTVEILDEKSFLELVMELAQKLGGQAVLAHATERDLVVRSAMAFSMKFGKKPVFQEFIQSAEFGLLKIRF